MTEQIPLLAQEEEEEEPEEAPEKHKTKDITQRKSANPMMNTHRKNNTQLTPA